MHAHAAQPGTMLVMTILLSACGHAAAQTAHFNADFTTREEAESFEHWVTYKDGKYVTGPLMEADHQYCGTKVRSDSRISKSPECPVESSSDGGRSEAPASSSGGGSDSPRLSYGGDSPRMSYGGDSPRISDGTGHDNGNTYGEYPPDYGPTAGGSTYPSSDPYQASPGQYDTAEQRAGVFEMMASSDKPACRTRFQVEWRVQLLPGVPTDEGAPSDSLEHWSHAADSHFYLNTNMLLRQAVAKQLGSSGDSNDIALASVSHSVGEIPSSRCGMGIRKHVTYRVVLDDFQAASAFQTWLEKANASLFRWLAHVDPAGVCGGTGTAEPVKAVWTCSPRSDSVRRFSYNG